MSTQPVVPVKTKSGPIAKSTLPVLCDTCGKAETDPVHDILKSGTHVFVKPESAYRHLYRVVFSHAGGSDSANVVASTPAEAVAHLGIAAGQPVSVSTVATRVEVATVDDARGRVEPLLPTVAKPVVPTK